MSFERRGSLTWIEALRPVPMFVGQLKNINEKKIIEVKEDK